MRLSRSTACSGTSYMVMTPISHPVIVFLFMVREAESGTAAKTTPLPNPFPINKLSSTVQLPVPSYTISSALPGSPMDLTTLRLKLESPSIPSKLNTVKEPRLLSAVPALSVISKSCNTAVPSPHFQACTAYLFVVMVLPTILTFLIFAL